MRRLLVALALLALALFVIITLTTYVLGQNTIGH